MSGPVELGCDLDPEQTIDLIKHLLYTYVEQSKKKTNLLAFNIGKIKLYEFETITQLKPY